MMSPFQEHVAKWRACVACPLATQRTRVVVARGHIPCDVTMLGEAPGKSEDLVGLPFVGPAGHLLDQIILDAMPLIDPEAPAYTEGDPQRNWRLKVAWTNVVACFPREAKMTDDHSPPAAAVKACALRVKEFTKLARPRLVVCVGETAKKWVYQGVDASDPNLTLISIVHPAAIIRMPWAQKGLAAQRCVVTLATAFEELLKPRESIRA